MGNDTIDVSQFTSKTLEELRSAHQLHEHRPVKNTPELEAYWEKVKSYDPVKNIPIDDFKRKIKKILDVEIKKEFVLTDDHKKVLANFSKWVYRMDDGEYDPDKGILLIGSYGTGKTTIMKAFSKLCSFTRIRPFKMCYCKTVNEQVAETKDTAWINEYKTDNWCLDEIGHETGQLNIWGNKSMLFGDLLEYRERHRKEMVTHATTNKDMDELLKIYGGRVESRIYSLFNVAYLDGKDFRKPE